MNIYYFAILNAVIGMLTYIWFGVLKKYGGYN